MTQVGLPRVPDSDNSSPRTYAANAKQHACMLHAVKLRAQKIHQPPAPSPFFPLPGLGCLQMESLSFLYRQQANSHLIGRSQQLPLYSALCSSLLFLCRPMQGEGSARLLLLLPEKLRESSDSHCDRTFNSEAGQRLHNYCAGFCSARATVSCSCLGPCTIQSRVLVGLFS